MPQEIAKCIGENKIKSTLELFEQAGKDASYFFAGPDYRSGYAFEREARRIFNETPELEDQMTEIAKNFLWKL